MAELHVVMHVGPLGIDARWPADIYFYDGLPDWAGTWEQVCQHFCHGEGRAYHFKLDGADLSSQHDITALYGGHLKAYDADKPLPYDEASGEEKLAMLDAALAEQLTEPSSEPPRS